MDRAGTSSSSLLLDVPCLDFPFLSEHDFNWSLELSRSDYVIDKNTCMLEPQSWPLEEGEK